MKKGSKIIQPGIYNTILAAPTRSGKGVSSVIPTLLADEDNDEIRQKMLKDFMMPASFNLEKLFPEVF